MLNATKIRIYRNVAQVDKLAKAFGCARWYWNNSLAETQKIYQVTGKGLGQFQLNARLPQLKSEVTWLAETHSQVLQSVSLNLSRAFVNFFERRAQYPQFKHKHRKHNSEINAAINIRNEAQRMIAAGIVVTANGGAVSRGRGRKSSTALVPLKLEAPSFTAG